MRQRRTTHQAAAILQKMLACTVMISLSGMAALLTVGCIPTPRVIGLKPVFPPVETESKLDRLRPTFRWERFPRVQDRGELDPSGTRIKAVSYELRLWKVGEEFPGTSGWIGASFDYQYSWKHECRDTDPGELVYRQQGLVHPEHTLLTALRPNSHYFWTVRAHFRLDGKPRVTEWSEQVTGFRPGSQFESQKDGCSYPATFHLIRSPG
jgi:hypothetical protein